MSPCVLGTNRDRPTQAPPCSECVAESRRLFVGAPVRWFKEPQQFPLEEELSSLDLHELQVFEYAGLPLGALVLPSLRWILRRHNLEETPETLHLLRQYMISAYRVACQFEEVLAEIHPQCVLVFNGMFYPEAVVRMVSRQHGVRVISHEVALKPYSAFFTEGEATAYPIELPDDFTLTPDQDARLDAYLTQRFQGDFSMAGIRFWPQMRSLSDDFWQRASQFKQVVPVFTNVVFDTSQGHANVVFPHMFAWLDSVLEIIRHHPDTYFVLRAHPDEIRPGKESRESVAQWVKNHQVDRIPNVHFVEAGHPFSSYELVQRAKFVMIYNSTIGLEASILGIPVLSGGQARFTRLPTVFFPHNQAEFRSMAEEFLNLEKIPLPGDFRINARRFLYAQLFQTSLPFDKWIEEDGVWPGFVTLKEFDLNTLLPANSPTMHLIQRGLLHGEPFLLPV